jgi:hypothetical protein
MVSTERAGDEGGLRVVAGKLLPGKVIGDGRYRLLAWKGTDQRANAQLWRARDGQLNRDVAVTVLTGDPTDAGAVDQARRTLDRAAHTAGVAHLGVARLLNVLSVGDGVAPGEGVLGLVVAEWTRCGGVSEVVVDGPVAVGAACRLLEPLAAVVEQAHHHGLVLGVDPRRVRLTADGLRLAFPGPPPHATPRDDVHGLGAILYLLLIGRWPTGRPPAPQVLRPEVPAELSEVTMRSLAATTPGGIRTSATLLQVLRKVAEDTERTDMLTPVPGEPRDPDSGTIWTTKRPVRNPARKRKLAAAVAVLVIASMAVFTWIATTAADYFTADSGAATGPSVSITPPPPPPPPTPTQPPVTPPNLAPQPAGPIAPASVAVFNVSGDTDNATQAAHTVDGDPSSAWRTDTYLQQFPALKPGIGLIVSFPQPANPSRLTIASPSAATQVEIRTAPSTHPPLPDTSVIATATLTPTNTTIDLHLPAPTQHILIWITQLAGTNRHYQSTIAELTFTAPSN